MQLSSPFPVSQMDPGHDPFEHLSWMKKIYWVEIQRTESTGPFSHN